LDHMRWTWSLINAFSLGQPFSQKSLPELAIVTHV
jgi:hypothetical protein